MNTTLKTQTIIGLGAGQESAIKKFRRVYGPRIRSWLKARNLDERIRRATNRTPEEALRDFEEDFVLACIKARTEKRKDSRFWFYVQTSLSHWVWHQSVSVVSVKLTVPPSLELLESRREIKITVRGGVISSSPANALGNDGAKVIADLIQPDQEFFPALRIYAKKRGASQKELRLELRDVLSENQWTVLRDCVDAFDAPSIEKLREQFGQATGDHHRVSLEQLHEAGGFEPESGEHPPLTDDEAIDLADGLHARVHEVIKFFPDERQRRFLAELMNVRFLEAKADVRFTLIAERIGITVSESVLTGWESELRQIVSRELGLS